MSRKSNLNKSLIENELQKPIERPENNTNQGCCKGNCNCMERFKKMTLGKQICICVFFSLFIVFTVLLVVIVINLRILMGNTYSKLDEKINSIYFDNLQDLTKEVSATIEVHKEISEKSINKTMNLLVDILSKQSINDYPLDWVQSSELPTISQVKTFNDPNYCNLSFSYNNMTYITPTKSIKSDINVLQKLNVLNPIWQRINLLMIGINSDINITRTFIMIENSTTSSQMLATIPGQSFNQSLSSSEFSSFSWYKNALSTSDLVMISRSTDPFYGCIPAAIGFSKGFNISTDMRGAVGVFFKADQIETLLSPLFLNQSSGSISYSIWSPVNIYTLD